MLELLPTIVACLILTCFSHYLSGYSELEHNYVRKERLLYTIMAIVAILLVGLRTNYNDTAAYIENYNALAPVGIFTDVKWSLGEYPAFVIANNCMKLLGFSTQSFLMIYAIATLGLYFWFVRKYTVNLVLSVYLMFTMSVYIFTMAAIKQCIAIAISLIAVDRVIQRKYVSFIIFLLLAALFHPFALMFIVCPLLCYKPWNWQTYFMILICVIVGTTIQKWFGSALAMMSDFGIDYNIDDISGEGVNIYRVAVVWVPVLLSLITSRFWRVNEDRASCLIMNLSMVCAVLMFIALFGNPVYFGRLANYFIIFQVISLPWMMQYFEKSSRNFLISSMVILFFAYSFYGNVLNGMTFDEAYSRISLMQYLSGNAR